MAGTSPRSNARRCPAMTTVETAVRCWRYECSRRPATLRLSSRHARPVRVSDAFRAASKNEDGGDRPGHDGDEAVRDSLSVVSAPPREHRNGARQNVVMPGLVHGSTSFRAREQGRGRPGRPGHDGDEAVGHDGVLRPHLRASIGTVSSKRRHARPCAGIHVLARVGKGVDGRDVGAKQCSSLPGHDGDEAVRHHGACVRSSSRGHWNGARQNVVMPGLVPGIHVLLSCNEQKRGWPGQARP